MRAGMYVRLIRYELGLGRTPRSLGALTIGRRPQLTVEGYLLADIRIKVRVYLAGHFRNGQPIRRDYQSTNILKMEGSYALTRKSLFQILRVPPHLFSCPLKQYIRLAVYRVPAFPPPGTLAILASVTDPIHVMEGNLVGEIRVHHGFGINLRFYDGKIRQGEIFFPAVERIEGQYALSGSSLYHFLLMPPLNREPS